MGLDNYPNPYPCEAKGTAVHDREGRIDCEATKCWFRDDEHVCGAFGTFCWFRGKCLAWALELMGEEDLVARCYKKLSSVRAGQFGRKLLKLAEAIRKEPRVVRDWDSARIQAHNRGFKGKIRAKAQTAGDSDYELALDYIVQGGRWYSKVAELGCGVGAWF